MNMSFVIACDLGLYVVVETGTLCEKCRI